MKANPGGHIDPKDLVGRDGLIEEYWRILDRQSLVLTSERRIGKTSVIRKMTAEQPEGKLAIFHDLEDTRTPLDFVDKVFNDVTKYLDPYKKTTAHALKFLTHLLNGAEFKGFKLPDNAAPHWKTLLTHVIKDLTDHQKHIVVFFWDEFPLCIDNIKQTGNAQDAMELLDVLRSLRQMNQRLRMVFTGSIGIHNVIASLKREGYANEPINDMAIETLPPLSPEGANDLALRLLEGEGIQTRNRKGLATAIARVTDCVPFYIQHVVDRIVREGGKAEAADVDAIVLEGLTDPGNVWHMRYFRERIDRYYTSDEKPLALAILDALAGSSKPLRFPELFNAVKARVETEDQDAVRETLIKLMRDHYLVQETSGAYRFTFALIQRWWKLHRGI
jgi:hypothetical protein